MTEWKKRRFIVTVKAYPNPSKKYGETVCVAGCTPEEGLIRLYPINFRALEERYQFKKYDILELEIQKKRDDPRPESYMPKLANLKILGQIPCEKNWSERRKIILPRADESMCQIQALNQTQNKSLGLFKIRKVTSLQSEKSPAYPNGYSYPAQLTFWNTNIRNLEIIPYIFKLKYFCGNNDCSGHEQTILDWEVGQLYRKLKSSYNEDKVIEKVKSKFWTICSAKNDVYVYVGNHWAHPSTFMILGFFYFKKDSSLSEQNLNLFEEDSYI